MRSGDMAHWPSLMLVGVAVWALAGLEPATSAL